MVVRTGRLGFQWMEPPYTPEEQKILDRACSGPPIAIYRRRETPATESKSPAPQGPEAKPGQTPKRP
jgi:hypothetical protein